MSIKVSLIVDDDRALRMLLRHVLQAEGFHVVEAEDGAQALEIVRTLGPTLNLLISDVQMPKLDGITLSGMVKAEYPRIPIILLSGDCEIVRLGRQRGQLEYVQKPFGLDTVLKVVRTVMRAHKVRPRTSRQPNPTGPAPTPI